jgi:hypothetical protein
MSHQEDVTVDGFERGAYVQKFTHRGIAGDYSEAA